MQDKASQHRDLALVGPDRVFSEKVAQHSHSRGCAEKGELVASNLIRRGLAVAGQLRTFFHEG